MVATASRVGTGNIAGVTTAIVLGGPGAVIWMWIMAILGCASALVESTLAQVYKEKDEECDLDIVPNELRKAKLNYVMSNSLGFGGHNACVVLKKYDV